MENQRFEGFELIILFGCGYEKEDAYKPGKV